jgi:hypothetical protein
LGFWSKKSSDVFERGIDRLKSLWVVFSRYRTLGNGFSEGGAGCYLAVLSARFFSEGLGVDPQY